MEHLHSPNRPPFPLVLDKCCIVPLAPGADPRYIRSGGHYKLLGTLALFAPMIGAFVASFWTPNWTTWSYYATVMPMTFGYSVFLCCQLGMSLQHCNEVNADDSGISFWSG